MAKQKELEKAVEQFEKFDAQMKSLTVDEVNKAPVLEQEPQTKIGPRESRSMDIPKIEPIRSIIQNKAHFDEKNRPLRDRDWEYVKAICENHEIIGESIELWTRKWGCDPAYFWRIPVNKPVYIPRHVAERIAECKHHIFVMEDNTLTGSDGMGTYYGAMAVKHTKHRLDCRPATDFRQVSMFQSAAI